MNASNGTDLNAAGQNAGAGGPNTTPSSLGSWLLQSAAGDGAFAQSPSLAPEAVDRAPGSALLLEIAWEVCNQVGGIYQVIRSKAPLMTQRWADRYFGVGPYVKSKASVEFEESKPTGWLGRALSLLADQGLIVHHGRWLVSGRPRVLLIEIESGWPSIDAIKYRLYSDHGISFPGGDRLIDEVVLFADAVRRLIEALCVERAMTPGRSGSVRPIVAHFHEWMGGLAIPTVRKQGLPVACIFTTHATLLGRYIAMSDDRFYDNLPFIDAGSQAVKYNIVCQHGIERACAHGSHVFTTVSNITAEECQHLLGRSVDLVTPNGLNIERYNRGHDQQRLHADCKEAIEKFVLGYFFPSYSFDLDKTLYFFTSGRFEPKNKGFDLCLEAMARLNAELKAHRLGKTVIFFVVSRVATKSINPLAMEKRGVLNELNDVCEQVTAGVREKLFRRAAAGGKLTMDDLVDEYWTLRYRRAQQALQQKCLPMVVTHFLENDQDDPVLNHIRQLGLYNREEDPVKIVYHPDFINPTNRLWGIEYDQFVRGCHVGLFPSAYEPWGYTPLECMALGNPAVTSDTSGFGRYVQENFPDHDRWGLTVLRRRGRAFHEAAADLSRTLLDYCRLDRRGRIAIRNEVDKRSWDFDWNKLGRAYHRAHDLALQRLSAQLGVSLTDPEPATSRDDVDAVTEP
ncbi:MAG: glycosyltransferase [Planctomycetota bacterium]|nr:glycosyltransferase [Planctomycetota bacterium]